MPSLSRIARDLAYNSPKWKIVIHNIVRGIDNNMYSRRELINFARAVGGADFLEKFSHPDTIMAPDPTVVAAVRKARYFSRYESPDNRIRANPKALPCARAGEPALSGRRLYRVVDHLDLLLRLLPSDNAFWDQEQVVDLGVSPNDARDQTKLSTLCSALGGLPADVRRFRLSPDGVLTHGILWFTNDQTLPFTWNASASEVIAKTARDKLGLVHLAPNDRGDNKTSHLFCLAFDGSVVDRVGHYRPCAFDSIDNRRFMVPRDPVLASRPAEWGRTADLSAIADNHLSLDGSEERVANQVFHRDFHETELLEFMYLGELKVPHEVVDVQFANRLAAL